MIAVHHHSKQKKTENQLHILRYYFKKHSVCQLDEDDHRNIELYTGFKRKQVIIDDFVGLQVDVGRGEETIPTKKRERKRRS